VALLHGARSHLARTLKDKIEAAKAELDCEVSKTLVGLQERGSVNGIPSRADILSPARSSIPLVRGKHWLVSTLGIATARRFSYWGVCSPCNGTTIRVDLEDRIERLMWGHCYENHIQQCFLALLSQGSLYVDVAAHFGYHAVLAASIVGPTGRVYAFEADPSNFERLQEYLRAFAWATALNKAAWIKTGSVVFERSSQDGESGRGTVTAVRDLKKGQHISISAVSLDDWAAGNKIENVSLTKIDAEGSEISILGGARDFLTQTKPAVITEINNSLLQQGERSPDEMVEILHECGYEVFHLSGRHVQGLGTTGAPDFCEVLCLRASQQERAMQQLRHRGFRIEKLRRNSGRMS
jgi:FkbM family methyltransferase